MCISSDGEVSLELSCDGMAVGISTDGAVTIGAKNDTGEASFTVGPPH